MAKIKFPEIKLPKLKFPKPEWPSEEDPKQSPEKIKKIHPWRQCPLGKHWRESHSRQTKKRITQVKGHCVQNPSKKDQIYPIELNLIAEKYFNTLPGPPKADDLKYSKGNNFDHLIRVWPKLNVGTC